MDYCKRSLILEEFRDIYAREVMGSSINYIGQNFELIPFGARRKMCPGMLLAVANFELALANLSKLSPTKKKCLADFGIVTQCMAPTRDASSKICFLSPT